MQDKDMNDEAANIRAKERFTETLTQLIASEAKAVNVRSTSNKKEHLALERKLKLEVEEFYTAVSSFNWIKEYPGIK